MIGKLNRYALGVVLFQSQSCRLNRVQALTCPSTVTVWDSESRPGHLGVLSTGHIAHKF